MSDTNLGYKTRTDAVMALKDQGKTNVQIGRMLGIPTKSVSALACSARRKEVSKPLRLGDSDSAPLLPAGSISKLLPIDVRRELQPFARKRDLPMDRMLFDILAEVARKGLVDRILGGYGGRAL